MKLNRVAEVAQLVEYLPSKQTVASSSLVFRSIKESHIMWGFFIGCEDSDENSILSSADFGKSEASAE